MKLENTVVFVSGANRGIGRALVEALLERGAAKVYAAARKPQEIPDFNDDRVVKIELDITMPDQVEAAAAKAADTEVLINNAGVATYASAFSGDLDKEHLVMNVNYFGTLAMMRAFIPVLAGKKHTVIANVASIASFVNFPNIGGYSASKAALFSITQGARIELAPKGISVHNICPGPIDTDMAKGLEMDKTSPEATAINILNGLEAGDPDIFPDPAGADMFKAWQKDYRNLEKIASQSLMVK